jgi:AraC-like DNA-binding protein
MDKRGVVHDHGTYLAPTYSVIWVLAGSGHYTDASGSIWTFQAGDCFQRWPGRKHSTHPRDQHGWYEWWVDCGPGLHAALADAQIIRSDPPVWTPESIPLQALADFRTRLSQAGESDLGPIAIQGLDLIARARQGSPVDRNEDLIDRACALLAQESLGRGDLRSWCDRQGLKYEAFRKAFTQKMGEPPGQYRIRRRLERACALLLSSDRSISGVAEDLGYASPYEFSAQFRRRFGLSPSAYRRQRP